MSERKGPLNVQVGKREADAIWHRKDQNELRQRRAIETPEPEPLLSDDFIAELEAEKNNRG